MKQGDLIAARYRLLRPVGAGAMGTVWAARHELLDRDVALKVAAAALGATPDGRALFLREARLVARLRHPNVVDVADAGEVEPGGDLYLAMELLEGEALSERIARGPLPPAEALGITAALCRGLAAAHAAGVVHRDLKPANVFLARGPNGAVVPKILDFGVSTALDLQNSGHGRVLTTPAYMSPEQANGLPCDERTDLWSLGVVLHEMLAGTRPFTADTYAGLLRVIDEQPAPPLPADVPAELRTLVAGCLAKDRDDRYPSAGAVLDAIDRVLEAVPTVDERGARASFTEERASRSVRGVSVPERAPPPPAGRPRFGLVATIFAVPVVIGIAAISVGLRRPPPGRASPPSPAFAPVAAPATEGSRPPAPPAADAGAPPPPSTEARPALATAAPSAARPPAAPAPPTVRAKVSPPAAEKPVTKVVSSGL